MILEGLQLDRLARFVWVHKISIFALAVPISPSRFG